MSYYKLLMAIFARSNETQKEQIARMLWMLYKENEAKQARKREETVSKA